MKLISLVFIILFVTIERTNAGICTQRQIKEAMNLACNSAEKRTEKRELNFHQLSASDHTKKLHNLWKKLFNINENTKLTIQVIGLQKDLLEELLSGRCNDSKRKLTLKSILEQQNKNQEYTNEQSNNYLNYESNEDDFDLESSYKSGNMMRYRREVLFIEECCYHQCSLSQLQKYCPT